jgi:hypothetical protein
MTNVQFPMPNRLTFQVVLPEMRLRRQLPSVVRQTAMSVLPSPS